jgi:tetratricopeptide (TPR) repeat protein
MAMMQSIQKLMSDLKENPENYQLNVQAGNAYFDIGRYQQALKYYKRANFIRHDENVMVDLGVCYFNIGKLDSALTFMQAVLEHKPDHKQALYNVGIVYYNLNNFNKALENWQHLIHVYPNTPEADRVQQYINEIKNRKNGS